MPAIILVLGGNKLTRFIYPVVFLAYLLVASIAPLSAQGLIDTVRDAVITAVKEKTGRTLTINGELSFSMTPSPQMIAEQVELSNPDGFGTTPFMTMEKIEISFDLVAALTGNMVINGFLMEKPTINLVVNQEGANNWSFGPEALQSGVFEIAGGVITYSDAQKKSDYTFTDVNLKIAALTASDPFTATGDLVWGGDKITLDASLDTLEKLDADKVAKIAIKLTGENFASELSGNITKQKDGYRFSNARFSADGMNATGTAAFKFGKARPYISADFKLDKLLLSKYLGTKSPTGKSKRGWSTQKFDFSRLNKFDGDFKLSTGSVTYQKIKTGAASVNISLKKGIVKISMPKISLYGGSAKLNLTLNSGKPKGGLSLNGNVKNVKALPFLLAAADVRKIEGRATISFNLSGSASSPLAFMQTLRGNMDVNFRNGALLGINIGRILRSVKRGKTSGFAKGGKTAYKKITTKFRFRKGIGRNKRLRMSGGEVRISGGGKINVPKQTLSYRVHPSLVGQGGISVLGINVPIIIVGPWANPHIYPDLPGFLDAPEIALKGLATVGKTGIKGVTGVVKTIVNPIGKIITSPLKKLF